MEKYGVGKPDLVAGLRNEEARLMSEMSVLLGTSTKVAANQSRINDLEIRLTQVRTAITEHDLQGKDILGTD